MRIHTWRQHSKTREWLRNYGKTVQLQSIREEFFWGKNKMYGGLCATYYQDQSRPYNYSRWYKRWYDTCQVSVSNLTTRNYQYRKKALEVNQHLKGLCHEKNISIIDHGNTITIRHLNGSRLHLNLKGNKIFNESLQKQYQIFYIDSLYYIVLEKIIMMVIVFITVMI